MKQEQSGMLANLDGGKSLRVLMSENNISALQLGKDLGLSGTTVAKLRNNKLISGKNIVMLCEYFSISAGNFIRKGEKSE